MRTERSRGRHGTPEDRNPPDYTIVTTNKYGYE
nr:MAG TPA: hypothetical protein [Caudoviricetes sp.]